MHIPKPRIIVNEDDPDACWGWTGSTGSHGYGQYWADRGNGGRNLLVHRLSYETWIGPIPDGIQIDHRCGNKTCCNPRHLRLATNKQNGENLRGARRDSRSGVRGVSWRPDKRKWRARVGHNGKEIHVGYFASPAEAEAAAIAKRLELFTHNDADR
jgi:hypothetical protein